MQPWDFGGWLLLLLAAVAPLPMSGEQPIPSRCSGVSVHRAKTTIDTDLDSGDGENLARAAANLVFPAALTGTASGEVAGVIRLTNKTCLLAASAAAGFACTRASRNACRSSAHTLRFKS